MASDNIAPNTPDTTIPLAHGFSKFKNISLYIIFGDTVLDEITVDRNIFVTRGFTIEAVYFDGVNKVQVMCKYASDTTAILSSPADNAFTVGYWIVGTN